MQGKVLVFAANAVIFLTLALLGLLLGIQLDAQAGDCGPEPDAICERTRATADTAIVVSWGLLAGSVVLALVAWWLHGRHRPSP